MGNDFEVIGRIVVDSSGAAVLEGIPGKLDGIAKKSEGLSATTSGLGRVWDFVWGNLIARAITGAAQKLSSFVTSSIDSASDLRETLSKTYEIFGKTFGEDLVMWSERSATAMGLSQTAALDAASMFAIFGKAAGLAGTELNTFAENNLQLSSDLASFFNTSVEDAAHAVQAAFRGEMEPIRRYGVLLDDASMRQEALAMGIVSTTKEALTPQQKVLAANSLLWKQTADAQGDFARTSAGYANQQRIFTAQIENAKAQLGMAFLPVLTKVMAFMNTQGIPVLQNVIGWFNNLSDAFTETGNIFSSEFLESITAWMPDDLQNKVFAVFRSLRVFFDFMKSWWETNGPGITAAAQRIFGAISSGVSKVGATILPFINVVLAKLVNWFTENGPLIQKFAAVVASAFERIVPVIVEVWGAIMPVLGAAINIIMQLATVVMAVATGDWPAAWEAIKNIVTSVWDALMAFITGGAKAVVRLLGKTPVDIKEVWSANWEAFLRILRALWDRAVDTAEDFVSKFLQIGAQIVQGIIQGVQNNIDAFIETIKDLIQRAISTALGLLGIESPSRVFAEIGENMMLGLADGIGDGITIPVKALSHGIPRLTALATAGVSQSAYYGGSTTYANRMHFGAVNNYFVGGKQVPADTVKNLRRMI